MGPEAEVDQALGLVDSVVHCHHREHSFLPSLYPTILGVGFIRRLVPKGLISRHKYVVAEERLHLPMAPLGMS